MKMVSPGCGIPPCSVFSCLYVYIHVFDGDVKSWQMYLRDCASPAQLDEDGPLVAKLAESLRERPELAEKISDAIRVIEDVAGRLEG